MGYQTDFVGYLHVTPPLNARERELVNKVSGSLFLDRQQSGLHAVDQQEAVRQELMVGAPRGWSNWTVCGEGCCLSYDGGDKANHMVPWLKFLMATLLVPGATIRGKRGFEEFTCDHALNGMVVGSRRDNRELYAICVRENVTEVEMLWPGLPEWSSYPALAYQVEIDRFREWALDYRRRPKDQGDAGL